MFETSRSQSSGFNYGLLRISHTSFGNYQLKHPTFDVLDGIGREFSAFEFRYHIDIRVKSVFQADVILICGSG